MKVLQGFDLDFTRSLEAFMLAPQGYLEAP